jgi:hypothetical protein
MANRGRLNLASQRLLASPVRAGGGKTLYLIVRNDLRVLEATLAVACVTRNRGYMGFDTLFVLDSRDHRPGHLHVERRESPRGTWIF